MKRGALLGILAGIMILIGSTASVYAAPSSTDNGYVDVDGNGICDNRSDSATCPQDGTGMKHGCADNGQYPNFVDTDKDGICDNRTDGATCPQDGTGMKHGNKGKENRGEDHAERAGSKSGHRSVCG